MTLYRCRFLDRTRYEVQMQRMACENDGEAMVMARRMSANSRAYGFELRQGERCVHIETRTAAA